MAFRGWKKKVDSEFYNASKTPFVEKKSHHVKGK